MTGRTSRMTIKKASVILNPFLFSTQMTYSRWALLAGPAAMKTLIGAKIASRTLASYAVGTVLLCTLANLMGQDVGDDPLKSDFGKIKDGDSYWDLTNGTGGMVRMIYQTALGKKRSATGRLYDISRAEPLLFYAQTKLHPSLTTLWESLTGKTLVGEPVEWKEKPFKEAFKRFAFLDVQDALEAYQHGGAVRGGFYGLLAYSGESVQTYGMKEGQKLTIEKNQLANEVFKVNWDQLSPEMQEALRRAYPHLVEQERLVKMVRTDYNFIKNEIISQQRAAKYVMSKISQPTAREMLRLNFTIGGLGRQWGAANYRVSDETYNLYKDSVAYYLDQVLTPMINNPQWGVLEDEVKFQVLERVTDMVKKRCRQELMAGIREQNLEWLKWESN